MLREATRLNTQRQNFPPEQCHYNPDTRRRMNSSRTQRLHCIDHDQKLTFMVDPLLQSLLLQSDGCFSYSATIA